jgi:putative redox protein
MAQAVVTIAAPSIRRVWAAFSTGMLTFANAERWRSVSRDGRLAFGASFLEEVTEQRLTERLAHLNRALLMFHSPMDDTVSIDNAD